MPFRLLLGLVAATTLSSCTFILDVGREQCQTDVDCNPDGAVGTFVCDADQHVCHERTPFVCMGSADITSSGTVTMTFAFFHLAFKDMNGYPAPVEDWANVNVRLCTGGVGGGACNQIQPYMPLVNDSSAQNYSTITFSGLQIGKSYYLEAYDSTIAIGTYDNNLNSLTIGDPNLGNSYVPGQLIPTIVAFGPVAKTDDGSMNMAFMFSVEHYEGAVSQGAGITVDRTKGMALGQVRECGPSFAPEDVFIETNHDPATTEIFYFYSELPTVEAMGTDVSGFVGISNLPGGNTVVDGFHLPHPSSGNDTQWSLGQMIFLARNGWFTNFYFEPYRLY